MIITISGTPGSGKSTVAKIVARKLKLFHYSTGDFMRRMAQQRGISLEEFGNRAKIDPKIDHILDQRQQELGRKKDNFVIDGRLSFHFIPHSIKVFIKAKPEVRARRILQDVRKGKRLEENSSRLSQVMIMMKQRQKSEVVRCQKYYGINPYNPKHYDLVLDSTTTKSNELAQEIITFIKKNNEKRTNPRAKARGT